MFADAAEQMFEKGKNMQMLRESIEYEEEKLLFKMIFNKNVEDYRFPGIEYLKLVNEYGKMCGDLEQSKKLVNIHFNIQEEFSQAGIHLDDDSVIEMIGCAIMR